ncbi:hypothetical protein [Sphingomonas alba]|uniref:DUF3329 domain-containing protein n=1 Tax=Sphingomonas alba TaxID=2908208 RepID=A0ABT0RKL1_9SPHN|nr:hypothetical protein [Sphingomonas alba]MCL6682987.1 hypothetical protein [Sphingomonas alba]
MDWYKLALVPLTIAVMPLFFVSIWCGLAALIAIYALAARLANKDFDRQSRDRANAGMPIDKDADGSTKSARR